MKRILSLFIILVLLLSTLASCNWFNKDEKQSQNEEPSIQEAVKELKDMYDKLSGTSLANGKELVAQVTIKKTTFKITWTSSDERVTVSEADGLAVVNIPTDVTENAEYTLTANLKSEGGQEAKYELKLILAASYGMITNPETGKAYKLALLHGNEGPAVVYFDGGNYNGYSYYLNYTTDILSSVDVYLEAVEGVEGGLRLYFEKDGVKTYISGCPRSDKPTQGSLELITTTPTSYWTYSTEYNTLVCGSVEGVTTEFYMGSSGQYKSISASSISHITDATSYPCRLYGVGGVEEVLPEQTLPTMPENPTSQDVVDYLYQLQPGQTSPGTYVITGKVTAFDEYSAEHGNITLTITVEGRENNPVVVYRAKSTTVDLATIKIGDTITVRGPVTNYSGTYETGTGTMIESVVPGTGEDVGGNGGNDNTGDLVPVVVKTPEVGVAYKFGMYQGNKAANYYLKGGMSGYYMATTDPDDYSSALDFYIEETEGGYYMYCMDGTTKTYVNFVVSGEYVNGKYETTPSTVFTFNSNGIFSTTVNGEEYGFGTYNNYVTLGPNKTSHTTNFFGYFYTLGEAEEDEGNDDTTEPTYTAPVVGTAYKFYLEHTANNKNYFFTGATSANSKGGFYLSTSESADDAIEIYFETAEGGYNIYFMLDGVKTYLDVHPYMDGYLKCQFELSTEVPDVVWTYDTTYGVIRVKVTLDGTEGEFYAGNYSSNTTIRLSGVNYIDQLVTKPNEQFAAKIVPADGNEEGGEGENGGENGGNNEEGGNTETHTCVDANLDFVCDDTACAKQVLPADGTELTLTQAKALGLLFAHNTYSTNEYVISGRIIAIGSSDYGNITIEDEDGNKLYIHTVKDSSGSNNYGAITGDKPGLGDTVVLKGVIGCYSNSAQMTPGKIQSFVAHECDWEPATCEVPETCKLCGVEKNDVLLDHDYVEGVCTMCGKKENVTYSTVSKTHTEIASIAGVTVGQNTGVISDKEIKLDDNISIVCAKGGATSDPCIYSESIRLYQNGNTLTVKGSGMTKIVITLATKSGGQGPITVTGGTASELDGYTYTITVNAEVSEVVITTAGTTSSTRLYISNIEVTYEN